MMYRLFQSKPEFPDGNPVVMKICSSDSLSDCVSTAMFEIFHELGDGDGENGGAGSLWRCARDIYDCIKELRHYCYADCEWWIEKTEDEKPKLNRYIVSMAVDSRVDIEVEAENPQDAYLKTEYEFADVDLKNAEVVGYKPVNCSDAETGDIICDY